MCYTHAAALVAEYLKRKGEQSSFWKFLTRKILNKILDDTITQLVNLVSSIDLVLIKLPESFDVLLSFITHILLAKTGRKSLRCKRL